MYRDEIHWTQSWSKGQGQVREEVDKRLDKEQVSKISTKNGNK